MLHAQPGSHLNATRRLFRDGGIGEDRVEFVARIPQSLHIHRYHELDLGLDPFPYSGGVTTMDSLWMGVPMITLAGRTAVGRSGASILSNAGLPGLIARSPDEYVAIAVAWAQDLERLAHTRARLRDRMLASPLMDAKKYAADLEEAMRGMWKRWCSQ
jgi:predicted O-linked N-acetylglucosamine transferase (SPINDLY family)